LSLGTECATRRKFAEERRKLHTRELLNDESRPLEIDFQE